MIQRLLTLLTLLILLSTGLAVAQTGRVRPPVKTSCTLLLWPTRGELCEDTGADATRPQYTFDGALSITAGGLALVGDLTITDATNGTKIGASGSKWSFDGNTPSATATFTAGNTDNEIGGLSIGAAYSQAEIQALRDKCEELADDFRSLVAELKSKGLLK